MTALVLAMIGTLAIGFMAGREYDRGIKRVKANQRRRREEAEKKRADALQRRMAAENARKNDYMFNVTWNCPNGNR